MGMNITELNSKNFDKFIKEDKVVVDFWAAWCGPCKVLAPIFEEASKELKDKAKFGKVDVDKNSELAQRFNIRSIPALVFFRDGIQVDSSVGILSKEELAKKIKDMK